MKEYNIVIKTTASTVDHFVDLNKMVLRFTDTGLWELLVKKSIKTTDHFVEVNKMV